MNYIFPAAIVLAIPAVLVSPCASAADAVKSVGLTCQVERILDKEKLPFSVVLDEKNSSATVNETVFKNSEFTPFSIKGKIVEPHFAIAGLNRVIEFSLDRLTGQLFFGVLTATASGGPYTEQQKEQLAALAADPVFIGTCKTAKPMF